MRRGWWITAMLALVGLGTGLWLYLNQPTVLTVAAGPVGSDDVRLIAALALNLQRERESVRIKLILTDGYATSAKRLKAGEVDLAVLRSDIDLPDSGATVAILRRDTAMLVAPAARGIARIGDLDGKRIGINRLIPGNRQLIETILKHYELDLSKITIEMLAPGENVIAFREGRIDAIMAVAPVTSRGFGEAIAAITANGGAPVFIPLRENVAMAQRNPAFDATDIVRGVFGGDPPRPAETVPAITVTRRLFARRDLAENTVSELAKALYDARSALQTEVRSSYQIEAPDTERDSAIPTHPGAAAFIDGEQQTFFERYGDWMYLGIMGFSLVGSVLAAMWSSSASQRRRDAMMGLDRLIELLAKTRLAHTGPDLSGIETEADEILAKTLARSSDAEIDTAGLAAYRMAFDQLGRAVRERRTILMQLDELSVET
jgi:TRAP transporter TAXI family solute receptor